MAGLPDATGTQSLERCDDRAASQGTAGIVLAVRAHQVERRCVKNPCRAVEGELEQFGRLSERSRAKRRCRRASADEHPPSMRAARLATRPPERLDALARSPAASLKSKRLLP